MTRTLLSTLAAALLFMAAGADAETPDEVRSLIVEEARETAVPVSLALAVAKTESGFDVDRLGPDGARGVMQILPETAESLGVDARDLWEPRTNVRLGLDMLEKLLERTDGRWDETLHAYAAQRPGHLAADPDRYTTSVLKWERRFAEHLAAADPIDRRRREVLKGHDDWGSEAEGTEVAGIDPEDGAARDDFSDLPDFLRPEAVGEEDELENEYEHDEEAEADEGEDHFESDEPVQVNIFRGGGGADINITVHEPARELPAPPPPPAHWGRGNWHDKPAHLNRGLEKRIRRIQLRNSRFGWRKPGGQNHRRLSSFGWRTPRHVARRHRR